MVTPYTSGQTVRSSAAFVNGVGAPADPSTVTVTAQFGAGSPPVTQTAVHDSTGAYHCEIDVTWDGPGLQTVVVTWAGVGNDADAELTDVFQVQASAASATDSTGP